ncbi:MAG TPA: aldolase/citrate lyase family protein [Vicinamibacterales bacterium]|nr:aldolase/citrate lyase family protein [Vicinamibacterales bacterium]
MKRVLLAVVILFGAWSADAQVLDLWPQGKVAFGVYAPSEAERGQPPVYTPDGAAKVAANPLYDFVFLNLEGAYDAAAVKAYAAGLKKASNKTLIVRIPPISKDGADATRARVKEILDAGADGVTIPHVRDLDEAKLALSFFTAAKANVWSPKNPNGTKLAMLMLEDPKAIAQRKEIADLPGLSILACGIGSLAQALGGDRAAAEAGTQQVLAETKRVRIANMLPANMKDVEQRVKEGFLAILGQGPQADEMIKAGRAAAGR